MTKKLLNKYLKKIFFKVYRNCSPKIKKILAIGIKNSGVNTSSFYSSLNFRGKFKVKVANGRTFRMIHSGGNIEDETFWNGLFETWESDNGWIWMELCKCSEVILDIGANTGIYSLVAKSINFSSSVYAFEPSVPVFEKLEANVKLNKFDIKCKQLAVSNVNYEQLFYDLPVENQTSASLSPEKMKNWIHYRGGIWEYKVKSVTLSDFIQDNNLTAIDLIKLDIEMHEAAAIEGLGKYLLLFKPIVIIEILSEEQAIKLNELIDLEDFYLYHLRKNHTAKKIKEFKVKLKNFNTHEWNYIFFHKSLESKIRRNTSLFDNIVP